MRIKTFASLIVTALVVVFSISAAPAMAQETNDPENNDYNEYRLSMLDKMSIMKIRKPEIDPYSGQIINNDETLIEFPDGLRPFTLTHRFGPGTYRIDPYHVEDVNGIRMPYFQTTTTEIGWGNKNEFPLLYDLPWSQEKYFDINFASTDSRVWVIGYDRNGEVLWIKQAYFRIWNELGIDPTNRGDNGLWAVDSNESWNVKCYGIYIPKEYGEGHYYAEIDDIGPTDYGTMDEVLKSDCTVIESPLVTSTAIPTCNGWRSYAAGFSIKDFDSSRIKWTLYSHADRDKYFDENGQLEVNIYLFKRQWQTRYDYEEHEWVKDGYEDIEYHRGRMTINKNAIEATYKLENGWHIENEGYPEWEWLHNDTIAMITFGKDTNGNMEKMRKFYDILWANEEDRNTPGSSGGGGGMVVEEVEND